MGALIMAHGDNNGLVLPPAIAPIQVVFVPIYKGQEELERMVTYMKDIASELEKAGISTKIDDRDNVRSGFKFAEWELKGVPVRIVIGPTIKHWRSGIPRLLRSIPGRSSRSGLRKAVSCSAIGTVQPRPR